jgi:hypothetical protein
MDFLPSIPGLLTIARPVSFTASGFGDGSNPGEGAVCIPNISPKERRKRLRFAILQFAVSIVLLGALLVFDVNPLWRLSLFFIFSAAATSYFQARDKT